MRGTNDKDDLANDVDMAKKKLPNQYADAQKFYEKVKKDFPKQEILFTGHSLGGSLTAFTKSSESNVYIVLKIF